MSRGRRLCSREGMSSRGGGDVEQMGRRISSRGGGPIAGGDIKQGPVRKITKLKLLQKRVHNSGTAVKRKAAQIKCLRDQKKSLVTKAKTLEAKKWSLQRSADLSEKKLARAVPKQASTKKASVNANLKSNASSMRAELSHVTKEAYRDRKTVRTIIVAQEEERRRWLHMITKSQWLLHTKIRGRMRKPQR